MKIALTADVHLGIREDHPERYNALRDILEQLKDENIKELIIAGDLFDKDFRNYVEFEELCKDYSGIQLHVVPGNHDPGVSDKSIVGENISIYTSPTIKAFGSTDFLFLPYEEKRAMGEKIAEMESELGRKQWILIAHGDYYGGVKELNPLEPGTYMPLSRKDIERFKPQNVFLGHIHKPIGWNNVYYTGSPCGLDINETGKRRFLIYDTIDGSVAYRTVATDVLYCNESFVLVPSNNEVSRLEHEIRKRIESWDFDLVDHEKVIVRVKAEGYAIDRSAVLEALEQGFENFKYYKNEGPNIDNLSASSDIQLNAIAERTLEIIGDLDWGFGGNEPEKERVIVMALSVIYGA